MPTLTFTIGKEYGRTTGVIPVNQDFCGAAGDEEHDTHYLTYANLQAQKPDGTWETLISAPGPVLSPAQGH